MQPDPNALPLARQVLSLLALGVAAWWLGASVMPRSSTAEQGRGEGLALRLGGGLVVLALALLALGTVGWLQPLPIFGLVVAAALHATVVGRRRHRRDRGSDGAPVGPAGVAGRDRTAGRANLAAARPGARRWAPLAWLAALALALAPAFVLGLYPPSTWDETTYHLPFAATFAATGALPATPHLLFTVFPQLTELVAAALLVVTGSDLTPHVVPLLALAIASGGVVALAGRSTRARLVAAAAWLGTPLAHYQAGTLYVDLVMAALVVLAIVAWERWRTDGGGRWLVLAGAFAGSAAGVKYLALIWVAAVVSWTLLTRHPSWRRRAAATGLVVAAALATAGPWYLRIHLVAGSPVHPFLSGLLGAVDRHGSVVDRHLGLDGDTGPAELAGAFAGRFHPRVLGGVAMAPWRLAWERDRFQRQAPLSPWLPLLALAALAAAWKDPAPRRWLLTVGVYAALWTAHEPRFQLVSAALVAAAAGRAACRFGGRLPSLAWALASLALLLPGPAYASWRLWRQGPVPADAAARGRYLATAQPGYEALAWLAGRPDGRSATVYGIEAPYLAYHAPGRYLGFWRGRHDLPGALARLDDPRQLHAWLRAAGVDYLLLAGAGLRTSGLSPEAGFQEVYGSPRCRLLALATPGATPAARSSEAQPAGDRIVQRVGPVARSLEGEDTDDAFTGLAGHAAADEVAPTHQQEVAGGGHHRAAR